MEKPDDSGKSIWQNLYPGQKWAAIFGAILIPEMLCSCLSLIKSLGFPSYFEMILLLLFMPFVILIYCDGIGIGIAILIQIIFYSKKSE